MEDDEIILFIIFLIFVVLFLYLMLFLQWLWEWWKRMKKGLKKRWCGEDGKDTIDEEGECKKCLLCLPSPPTSCKGECVFTTCQKDEDCGDTMLICQDTEGIKKCSPKFTLLNHSSWGTLDHGGYTINIVGNDVKVIKDGMTISDGIINGDNIKWTTSSTTPKYDAYSKTYRLVLENGLIINMGAI